MIIYRMTGKREAFKACGLLICDPMADASKTRLLKAVKALSANLDKLELKHTFIVRKVTLKALDQTAAVALFGETGCVEDLIESEEVIGAFASKDLPKAQLMPEQGKPPAEKYDDDLPF